MPPDEPTDEEALEQLQGDGQTPAAPAGNNPQPTGPVNDPLAQAADRQLDDTHPATDTNIQREELYDEGVSGAAEASEPNAGDSVTKYEPPDEESPTSGGSANA